MEREKPVRFEDRVAFVTGAGSGIGQASATLFAREGAKVVVVDREEDRANETEARIREAGGEALVAVADVRREREVADAVERALAAFGRIDVLHNHAGVLPATDRSILEIDEATIDEALAINVKGMVLVGKHVARAMVRGGRGAIVNTASDLSLIALPGVCGYVTSKSAIPGLTRSMAVDLAPHGIRVNAVCPGFTYTRMVAGMLQDAEAIEAMRKTYLLKQLGQPEDVARVVLFLASDDAKYMTGALVPVDGGHTVQ